jgi:hypothetical protein
MIKNRIASGAAVFTFGLAALGGTVLAAASPANAAPGAPSNPHSVGSTPNKPAPTVGIPDNEGKSLVGPAKTSFTGQGNHGTGNLGGSTSPKPASTVGNSYPSTHNEWSSAPDPDLPGGLGTTLNESPARRTVTKRPCVMC